VLPNGLKNNSFFLVIVFISKTTMVKEKSSYVAIISCQSRACRLFLLWIYAS
jgi:hypothetical protein